MSDVQDKKSQGKWTQIQYEKLICCLCHSPLYPPKQLDCCGQRICEECTPVTKNVEFKCPSCFISCPNVILDKGFLREIESLIVSCPECGDTWVDLFKNLREHLKSHRILKCKHCEEGFVSAIQLEAHESDRCTFCIAPCSLSSFGCSNEVPHSEIGKHCLEIKHQQCLIAFVKHLLDQTLKSNSQNLVSEQHQRIAAEYLPRIESTRQEIDSINNVYVELNSKRQMTEAKTIEIREQLKKFNEESVNILRRIENLSEMLMNMKILSDEIKSKPVTGPSLMDADDTYTLKISLLLLSNDDSLTIHSNPFQSSEFGYRMRMSMTTQTDPQSKQRFILPSFGILRGNYDSILCWPFSFPIALCLVDLTGAQKHVRHSIKPESQAGIFGRPLDDANTPYQISHFYPIAKLIENGSNYLRDDHIFLRIHIDYTERGVHPF